MIFFTFHQLLLWKVEKVRSFSQQKEIESVWRWALKKNQQRKRHPIPKKISAKDEVAKGENFENVKIPPFLPSYLADRVLVVPRDSYALHHFHPKSCRWLSEFLQAWEIRFLSIATQQPSTPAERGSSCTTHKVVTRNWKLWNLRLKIFEKSKWVGVIVLVKNHLTNPPLMREMLLLESWGFLLKVTKMLFYCLKIFSSPVLTASS